MSYDLHTQRTNTRAHLQRLAAAGPGWQAYALRRAEELVKEDPTLHAGLVQDLEAQIGAPAVKEARRAAQWMEERR